MMFAFASKTQPAAEERQRKTKVPVLLNEGPETIGIMSVVLGNGGSLDTAVRKVASSNLPESSRLFKPVVDDADTRVRPDMRSSVNSMLSSLPEGASSYAMAVRLMLSASDAKDTSERGRLMDEARGIALDGLRQTGKDYSSGLNAPCMAIFSIGIMIPMVLMSVLPMLGVSGLFGETPVDGGMLSAITLVAIPAAVACLMVSIRSRNPFMNISRQPVTAADVMPFGVAIPVYLLLNGMGIAPYRSLCISLIIASIATLALLSRKAGTTKDLKTKASMLTEAIFDMGNYLLAGMPFDESFRTAVSARKGCSDIAERLDREMRLCRGECETAIRKTISPVSEKLAEAFVQIYRTSTQDIRESGRLALTLGKQIMDQESVRASIRSDLRGMTDTMSGTAAVFAPLVLGLSITILEPLSRLSEDVDVDGTALILSVYLTELSALISCTIAFLLGESGAMGIVRRFAVLLPASMAVFLATTALHL